MLLGILVIALIIVALIVATAVILSGRRERRAYRGLPDAIKALPEQSREQFRVGQDLVRLVERSLHDPVVRVTDSWEGEARELVRRWYEA